MWEPSPLATLWAYMACNRDMFAFLMSCERAEVHQNSVSVFLRLPVIYGCLVDVILNPKMQAVFLQNFGKRITHIPEDSNLHGRFVTSRTSKMFLYNILVINKIHKIWPDI
jgi:hypothetical protein